ncbi:sugar dehydrogenase complex small subunit [Thioclava kandeliae]|uniref:Sugar dehydrogenase complex small subunit n=1 Tax=Thioclava kandeliae TaxID=3070818 RepID=A0ABV1SIU6_9RHOB
MDYFIKAGGAATRQTAGVMSRRKFLGTTAALLAVTPVASRAFAKTAPAQTDVANLASLLTGKDVNAALAMRAQAALTENNPDFPANMDALQEFVAQSGATDIEALKDMPGFEGSIRQTAQDMISALYLGYVGTPKGQSAVDDVKFVTFTEALTFQLTHDYTPIPSYSRWGTDYWVELPKTN